MVYFKRFLLHGSISIFLLAGLAFTFTIGTSSTAFAKAQSCNSVATGDWSNNCTVYEGNISNFVLAIQEVIDDSLGGCYTAIDGHFGPNTFATVECFQRYHHLSVDGIVGPQTWNALQQQLVRLPSGGGWLSYNTVFANGLTGYEENADSGVWYLENTYTNGWCEMTLSSLCPLTY